MDEKEIRKSLEQQFKLLSKASIMAIEQSDFQSLKPITEAMIEVKNELYPKPFK